MEQKSQLHRYLYANRGCTTKARDEDLLSLDDLDEECGFAPVQCSHDGCEVTVNKQDVASHEQSCEFRSVTCEECDEAFKQKDYDRHSCVSERGVTELTKILQEFQGGEASSEILENHPQATRGQQDKNLVRQTRQQTVQEGAEVFVETTQMQQIVTRRLAGQIERQPNSKPRPKGRRRITGPSRSPDYPRIGYSMSSRNQCQPPVEGDTPRQQSNRQLTRPSMSLDHFRRACSISSRSQRESPVVGEIVVAGGAGKSYEIFNWSTQQWALYEDALFFDHTGGFSFFYDNKIMFCGGTSTNRVECLDIANYRTVCTLPVQLPGVKCGKGVLCDDEIFTFGESVSATSLENPFGSSVLVHYNDERKFSNYGIACVNDNAVVVVGGNNSYVRTKYERVYDYVSQGYKRVKNKESEKKKYTDDVALYYPSSNVMNTLAPLPYGLCDMAVVAHGDNIIILGGRKGRFERTCNDVFMYNITKQQCSKLPNMLEKRLRCAAVMMEDTIVVFGGESTNERGYHVSLNTTEYLVLGENLWRELPPMHGGRVGATACVLP